MNTLFINGGEEYITITARDRPEESIAHELRNFFTLASDNYKELEVRLVDRDENEDGEDVFRYTVSYMFKDPIQRI